MTEILSAVSPSVFSWSMLGHQSSAAFLLLYEPTHAEHIQRR